MDTPSFTEEDSLSFTLFLITRTRTREKLLEHAESYNISVDTSWFPYVGPPFITTLFQTVQILRANTTYLSLCSSHALTRRKKMEFSLEELFPKCCVFFSEALSRSREQLSVHVSTN